MNIRSSAGCLGAIALLAAGSALAESTYQWKNTADCSADFSKAENWDGTAPVYTASGQLDDVFLFDGDLPFYQTAYQGTVSYGAFYYFGTILGTASHLLAGGVNGMYARGMMVKDAHAFEGSIGARTASSTGGADWFLASTPETPTVVKNARLTYGMDLNVYNVPGATGIVEHIWGPGFWRAGAGGSYWASSVNDTVLRVDDSESGPQSAAIVQNKSTLLMKGGHPVAPGVVGTPAVHLDATDAVSFVWDGGRIVSWKDVRDNGFVAVADGANPGPVVTTDAESQLPFVDFGAMNNRVDEKAYGAGDAATLVFDGGAIEGIREVFIVFKDQKIHNQKLDPGLSNNTTLLVQNFLGNAGGASQYFSRWMQRRSDEGFYRTFLLDANTQITAAGGNYLRDVGTVTEQNVTADVRVNGARVMAEYTDDFSRHANVLSVGYAGETSVVQADRLACNGSGHIGGIQIGELVVYTNALTSAQRREVNAYLLAKWCAASERGDLDLAVAQETSGAHLKAADGTLAVGTFDVRNAAVAMDGNLRVETFSGTAPTITFANGASNLTVAASPAMKGIVVPSEPVGEPEIWLDANRNVTTFDTNCFGKAITYVSGWTGAFEGGTNRWGSGISASRVDYSTTADKRYVVDQDTGLLLPPGTVIRPCFPTLADAGHGNLKMVDFGPQYRDEFYTSLGSTVTSNLVGGTEVQVSQVYSFKWKKPRDASAFSVKRTDATGTGSPADNDSTRTAFYVLRCNNEPGDDAKWPMTFGSRDCCAGDGMPLSAQFCNGQFRGAEWRVNGRVVDPFVFVLEAGRTYVVTVRLTEPVTSFATLCYYSPGEGSGSWGGMSYGELIGYPHRLTDREVVENEAYLMDRWLDEEHPEIAGAAGQTLSGLAFADASVAPSVTVEKPLAVGTLSVAGTSFAKRGSAALSVASSSKNISTFAVEGGSLTTTQDWLDDAALHLDASDYDSFIWRDGQVGTSIVSWQDVRRNGKEATSVTAPVVAPEDVQSGYRGHNAGMTNAQYRVSNGTDGLVAGMGYVDFLKTASKYNWGDNKQILAATNDCAGMTIPGIANAREVHVVYARNGNSLPLGTKELNERAWVQENLMTSVFYSGCTIAKGAAKRWDGSETWTTGNSYPSNYDYTFHVMTLAARDDMNIDYLGMDRNNCQRGGVRVCEVIIFAGETNTTARAEQIHNYLLKKWRNLGAGAVTGSEVANVKLTNGGTLALENDVALKPDAAISASVTATGVSAFTVGGTLTVNAGVTLTVTIDDTMARAKGEWIVLSAKSIVNPENLSVRIVGPDRATMRTKTVWESGKLVLKMAPAGLVMILR